MKKITIGILAHVDAGKTTLSENLLYECGAIRSLGRVDSKDAHLDTDQLEKDRGITIYSKSAQMVYKDLSITLLDTPGHVDFASEMERTLSVLDYAILLISGSELVQSHTRTLWRLLDTYNIPTIIFINKMDLSSYSENEIISNLKNEFGNDFVRFPNPDYETIATASEDLLNEYLENDSICMDSIRPVVASRKIFPVFFGSALSSIGIRELLDGLCDLTIASDFSQNQSGRIFKISRDTQGHRISYVKLTGGTLQVRDTFSYFPKECSNENESDSMISEKITQMRKIEGDREVACDKLEAGDIGVLYGLSETYSGLGFGDESSLVAPILEPVLSYRILLPKEIRYERALLDLKCMEEEDPLLMVHWEEETKELIIHLMGPIQLEVLQQKVKERFGYLIMFGPGKILYKETIASAVEGVGHFEPLRHYAEAHILMEPLERGSGIEFATNCSVDLLATNWQRLILTHLAEKQHKGVLCGVPVTDIRFTVIAGKAHTKHTEGGDFRKATYRAVRQGLMKAESILLEPYYKFTLRLPTQYVGRALTDFERMHAKVNTPETSTDFSILSGRVPVASLGDYAKDVAAYTAGNGDLSLIPDGYDKCHNTDEVIEQFNYDPESDFHNPTGSVFCAGGAGYVVPWYEVEEKMHVPSPLATSVESEDEMLAQFAAAKQAAYERSLGDGPREGSYVYEEELKEIYEKNFGPVTRKNFNENQTTTRDYSKVKAAREEYFATHQVGSKKATVRKKYFLVDGYNVIFAWPELNDLANDNLDGARGALLDVLDNYHGFIGGEMIVVFDAYKVKGNPGSFEKYGSLHVVYTKEAETADAYIEKTCHEIAKDCDVTVATSDRLEQMIVLGEGARRISSRELQDEIKRTNKEGLDAYNT